MKVFVNDTIVETNAKLLNELLKTIGYQNDKLAVAVNGKVVTKEKWEETALNKNDEIIIIKAVSGG